MNSQKIALFAASGEVGRRITEAALKRGHIVTAIVRDENEFKLKNPNLKVVKGDIKKKEDVRRLAQGNDVVICAHEPNRTQPSEHVDVTRSVIAGVKESGVNHLLFAAHPIGITPETSEEFYNSFKPVLKAQQEALKLCQNEKELHWGYAHSVEPEVEEKGKLEAGRSPKYTFSNEVLFTHPEGESRIPLKEYASAIVDEAEKGEMSLHHNEQERKEY